MPEMEKKFDMYDNTLPLVSLYISLTVLY